MGYFLKSWLFPLFPGTICLCFGICISMVDLLYPHKFSTIMEMDYGTPFDRVTIIELSSEHKKRKKVRQPGQESPQSLFTGLIRRLSKREKGSASREVSWLTGAWALGDSFSFPANIPGLRSSFTTTTRLKWRRPNRLGGTRTSLSPGKVPNSARANLEARRSALSSPPARGRGTSLRWRRRSARPRCSTTRRPCPVRRCRGRP